APIEARHRGAAQLGPKAPLAIAATLVAVALACDVGGCDAMDARDRLEDRDERRELPVALDRDDVGHARRDRLVVLEHAAERPVDEAARVDDDAHRAGAPGARGEPRRTGDDREQMTHRRDLADEPEPVRCPPWPARRPGDAGRA